MKKIIGLFLTITMLLSSMTGVFAATTPFEDIDTEATTVLYNLGVICGDENGAFNPEDEITRAEFAKILCTAYGTGDIAPVATKFADVASTHWAAGYINRANELGFIHGYGDGNFGPEDSLTYEQAIKLIVAALGYTYMADDNGGYPAGYMMVASDNDITKNVDIANATAPAKRIDVMKMLYNALEVGMMKRTTYGTEAKYEITTDTLLANKLRYIKVDGVISDTWKHNKAMSKDTVRFESKELKDYLKLKETDTDTFILDTKDAEIADLLHYPVVAYMKDVDDELVIDFAVVNGKKIKTTVITDMECFDDSEADADDKTSATQIAYWVDKDNDKRITVVDVATDVTYIVNTAIVNKELYDTAAEFMALTGTVELIDYTNDGKIDIVNIKSYDVRQVARTIENKIIVKGKPTIDLSEDVVASYSITLNGKPADIADLAENDVLWVACGKDTREIIATRNPVVGKVSEVGNDNEVIINGVEYKNAIKGKLDYSDDVNHDGVKDLTVNAEGTFYLDCANAIRYYDADVGFVGDYAYIIAVGNDTFGEPVIKMFTYDGKTESYSVAENSDVDGALVAGNTIKYSLTNGEIKKAKVITFDTEKPNGVWQSATNRFKGAELISDNAKVFLYDDENDHKVVGVDYLVNDKEYTYKVAELNDDTHTYDLVYVIAGSSVVDASAPLAFFVKATSAVIDEDTNGYKITFVENGVEKTVYSENATTLAFGDVFIYTLDEKGLLDDVVEVVALPNVAGTTITLTYPTDFGGLTSDADNIIFYTEVIDDVSYSAAGVKIMTNNNTEVFNITTDTKITVYDVVREKYRVGDMNADIRENINVDGHTETYGMFFRIVDNKVVELIVIDFNKYLD